MPLRSLLASLARRPKPSGGALLPALDALRGVAALAVLAQHLGDSHLPFVRARVAASVPAGLAPWVLTVLHHAHWGVDLFFVLSGFSLAQPLLGRLARAAPGEADPLALSAWGRSFAIRRAARLYPAYLAALALVVIAAPSLVRHPAFPAALAAHLAMLQGIVLPGGLAFIGAAWSLSTEVCFYAAWPLLGPLLLRGSQRTSINNEDQQTVEAPARPAPDSRAHAAADTLSRLRPWGVGVAVVVGVWLVRGLLHEVALRPGAPGWMLEASQRRWAISRLDQFVIGALAAALHARLTRPRASTPGDGGARGAATTGERPRARWGAPIGLAISALALPPAFYLEGALFGKALGAWPYGVVSVATGALVLAAAATSGEAANWLFPRPLRAVGVISYGVFLNHQLAIGLTARLAGPPGSWAALGRHAALSVALSLVAGALSWVLVERPVIEWAARRTGRYGKR